MKRTDFLIKGISPDKFAHLFKLEKDRLTELGIRRFRVDSFPGFPCRISLEDVPIGDEVLLLPYEHHQTSAPYRASGPVFIRKNATPANLQVNEIPKMLKHRFLSLRTYDRDGMMLNAQTVQGTELNARIKDIFKNPDATYIHVHNAEPGCFNCEIRRVV